MKKKVFQFKNFRCRLYAAYYLNERKALILVDAFESDKKTKKDQVPVKNREQVAMATIDVPNMLIRNDQIIVKDYTENEGMLEFLISNKIIKKDTVRPFKLNYTTAYVATLTPKALKLWEKEKKK